MLPQTPLATPRNVLAMNEALLIQVAPEPADPPVAVATIHASTTPWWRQTSPWAALIAFLAFCVVVLTRSTAMLEPDDFAYRASIVALSHGEILLTNAQYVALKASLSGQGVLQWHHMASGYWISEKNPGYPFFAVLFYAIGLLRLTPLFYGALACVGIFVGMRRWVSSRAAALAVWIYCFSGAALTFAWRDTMPSFSDASLIAAGFGLLVWVLLATEASNRRRLLVGLGAFVALECAVFIRYTNLVELGVAVVAVLLLARRSRLRPSALLAWGASVLALGALLAGFDQWAYGSATTTAYSAGEISFSLSSLWPNLVGMPAKLTTSMPMWLFAAAAVITIIVRRVRQHHASPQSPEHLDARIGAILAAGWLGPWLLYLCYTWTVGQLQGDIGGGITVHVIRFYLPALGLVAMLAAWMVNRFVRPAIFASIAVLVVAALFSFSAMASSGAVGGPGGPGFGGGPGGPGDLGGPGFGGGPGAFNSNGGPGFSN